MGCIGLHRISLARGPGETVGGPAHVSTLVEIYVPIKPTKVG